METTHTGVDELKRRIELKERSIELMEWEIESLKWQIDMYLVKDAITKDGGQGKDR